MLWWMWVTDKAAALFWLLQCIPVVEILHRNSYAHLMSLTFMVSMGEGGSRHNLSWSDKGGWVISCPIADSTCLPESTQA